MYLDFTVLDQVFSTVDTHGKTFAMNFATSDTTEKVFVAAVIFEIVAALVILLSNDGKGAMKRLFEAVIPSIAIAAIILHWQTLAVDPAMSIADDLVKAATGGQTSEGLGHMVIAHFSPAIKAISTSIFPSSQSIAQNANNASNASSIFAILGSSLITAVDSISSFFVMMSAVAILVGAMAACWASLLIANVVIYLALCFGPIILALSIIGKLRSMMSNWLGFFAGAIFYKPVLGVLIMLCLDIVTEIGVIAGQTGSSTMPTTVLMVFTSILSLAILGLILNATQITGRLFGGLSQSLTPDPTNTMMQLQMPGKPGK